LRVSGTDPRIASVKDAILSPEAPPRALRALPGPLPRWFPPLAGAALGAVFLLAAAAKGADPHAFVEQVESYRIVTGVGARAFAYALVPIEAALGTSLLLGLFRRTGMLASALLLLFFIGVTAYGWSQGRIEGCGCFGVLATRGPGEVIVEDVLLLALAGLALLPVRAGKRAAAICEPNENPPLPSAEGSGRSAAEQRPLARALPANEKWQGPRSRQRNSLRARVLIVLACGIAAVVFEIASPALPIDDYVTTLRPGRKVEELDLGLEEGEPRMVALIDIKSDRIRETTSALNALASQPGVPKEVAFASAGEQERGAFFWNHGPLFELREAPAASMRPLYRKLPRFFLVGGGRVLRVWNDRPPSVSELASLLSSIKNKEHPATGAAGEKG